MIHRTYRTIEILTAISIASASLTFGQAQDTEALNEALQQQIDAGEVSGVVALVARENEVVYHEAFGHRILGENEAPMQKDTLFRIYSMTKPIVAVAAMSVWEEKKFQLDDPISRHLPEWKSPTVRSRGEAAVTGETPITPRHLMTHSSGITYAKEGLRLDRAETL